MMAAVNTRSYTPESSSPVLYVVGSFAYSVETSLGLVLQIVGIRHTTAACSCIALSGNLAGWSVVNTLLNGIHQTRSSFPSPSLMTIKPISDTKKIHDHDDLRSRRNGSKDPFYSFPNH